MPLPNVERVIYKKNPLIEVALQIRFPRFLQIEAEAPAEFQKLIVKDYPNYEQRNVVQFVVSSGIQSGSQPAPGIVGKQHVFISEDSTYSVVLAGDAISFVANDYKNWDEFIARANTALAVFLNLYPLKIFSRISLRYQNVINPGDFGMTNWKWPEILAPQIAGELVLGSEVAARTTVATIVLGAHRLLLRHGLVKHRDSKTVGYMIDGEFYNDEQRSAKLDETISVAKQLHSNSGRLFRWCISDRLHAAMEPTLAQPRQ